MMAEYGVGDVVMVRTGGIWGRTELDTVERVTRTQIILKRCRGRYREEDGRQIGGSGSVSMATKVSVAKIEYGEALASAVYEFRSLSDKNTSIMENIDAIIDAAQKVKNLVDAGPVAP